MAAAAAVSQHRHHHNIGRGQEISSRQQQQHHNIGRGLNNNNINSSDSSIHWRRWQDCLLNMLFESTNANIICEYDNTVSNKSVETTLLMFGQASQL